MDELKTYTLDEVEKILQLTRRTLYRHIKSGKLPAVKIGREWRIGHEALAELIAKGDQK